MTHDEAAQALGMKTGEIVDIRRVDGGHLVTTHDGQETLVPGRVAAAPALPAPADVAPSEPPPAAVAAPGDAKAKPKSRGRKA